MSLTYTTYINSIVNLMPVPSAGDPGFQVMLPNMIDDAEQRLYRELNLIDTISAEDHGVLTPGPHYFSLPTNVGTPIVVMEVNIYTPAGTFDVSHSLVPASQQMVNYLFNSSTYSALPQYFANVGNGLILPGPFPDQAYNVETYATYRPAPISTTNVTTLLSVFFPDLFIAASMVFAAAYQKNFGAAVDDPKSGVTWEAHYQSLVQSAQVEEMRKRFTGAGWSSESPAPLATPPRT